MNQVRAVSDAKFSQSGEEDLWLTVPNSEDKSRTDDWDEALAASSDSVTVRRAVSVE